MNSKETILVRQNGIDIKLQIPDAFGEMQEVTVVWIRPMTDRYIQASLKTKDDGYTIWLCKVLDDSTLQPISCTMYLDPVESNKVRLMEKLNVKGSVIEDKLLTDRIERIKNGPK